MKKSSSVRNVPITTPEARRSSNTEAAMELKVVAKPLEWKCEATLFSISIPRQVH
jgi:hypothetical protein